MTESPKLHEIFKEVLSAKGKIDMDESSISRKTLTVPEMGLGCSMQDL